MLPLTKYMSLSTMSALVAGAVAVAAFGGGLAVSIMYAGCVLFVIAVSYTHLDVYKRQRNAFASTAFMPRRRPFCVRAMNCGFL